ncbi:MAG: NERD domain-containing protein [Anaerolineales bacterium]
MNPSLKEVLALAHAGRRDAAVARLRRYLREHDREIEAWVILSRLAPDAPLRLAALRRALELEPGHPWVRRAFAALGLPGVTPRMLPSSPEPPPIRKVAPPTVAQLRAAQDARAALWPRRSRRDAPPSLGQLMDEGRLTRQDLIWAAAEAENATLRAAAATLLDAMHRLPNVAMTPETAQLISWPRHRSHRPLGQLVRQGVVKEKELREAAWFAEDPRVREAARMMLPQAAPEERRRSEGDADAQEREKPRVKEPDSPAPTGKRQEAERRERPTSGARARPLTVVQGANYLTDEIEQRYRRRRVAIGGLLGWLAIISLLWLGSVVIALRDPRILPLWMWPIIAGLAFPLIWGGEYLIEVRRESQNFYQRQQAELAVMRQLRHVLDSEWTLFRYLKLPRRATEMGMVLLGPPGVFVLEVQAYQGLYRCRGDRCQRRTPLGWRPLRRDPLRRADKTARQLERYLMTALKREVDVEPRVVWAGPGTVIIQEGAVSSEIWFADRITGAARRVMSEPARLSPQDRAALASLLRGLCSAV